MHSLLLINRPEIKYEEDVKDIIPVDTSVASATLKVADQTILDAMNPFCCVLLFYLEAFVAQICSNKAVEEEICVSTILTDPPYHIWSSQHFHNSEHEYLSMEQWWIF